MSKSKRCAICKFGDLKNGERFTDIGRCYIKINDLTYNAVNTKTGISRYFEDKDEVLKVQESKNTQAEESVNIEECNSGDYVLINDRVYLIADFREHDGMYPTVDIVTGEIVNWFKGRKAELR